jgi:hypothetical protein
MTFGKKFGKKNEKYFNIQFTKYIPESMTQKEESLTEMSHK